MSKKTVEEIIDSGNDYLIKVKKNQPKLDQAIEEYANNSSPVMTHQSQEKSRDRDPNRQVEVFTPPPNLDPAWTGKSGAYEGGIANQLENRILHQQRLIQEALQNEY